MVQNLRKYLIDRKILFGLSLVFLGLLVFPLWKNNSLEIYDAPGHVSLAWFIKEYLWPQFSGWNPYFLSGFPQGIFYPSLFHLVAATLGFFVGVGAAIKLIVSLSILALPFSIFYAVKNTVSEEKYYLPFTFLVVLFLTLLPNFLGIGFRGLFQIGLIPNFVSTLLLFIFIGVLHEQFKQGKFLLLSIVHASLILTHIVAVAAAELYLFIYVFLLWRNRKLNIKSFVWLMILGPAMTAFFWIPFWANFSLTSVSTHVASYFTLNIVLAVLAIPLVWFGLQKRLIETLALATFALVILLVAVIDSYLVRNNIIFESIYSLHFYRFQPYAYLALILAVGSLIPRLRWSFDEKYLRISTAILFVILLVYLFARSPVVSDSKITLEDTKLGGRFIESFRRTESDPLLYTAQTNLVKQNPEENQWAYGLFTDATPNGPYVGSLIRSLRPEAYPEGEDRFIESKVIDKANIQEALDIFGIKYRLNLSEAGAGKGIGTWEVQGEKQSYTVEKVGEGKLAEVLKLNPIPVGRDFEGKVEEWWDQDSEWSTLPFQTKTDVENLGTQNLQSNTKVEIINHNKDWTKIKLNIASDTPQPVLIKFSYFPWWSAHQNGREVQVYRAAPNMMLIFANGEVDLEFKKPVWLNFLYLISAATLLAVIFQLSRQQKSP